MSDKTGKVTGQIEMNPATGAWKHTKASELAAPAGSEMTCPFCLEPGFDASGLKGHLVNNDCSQFADIVPPARLFPNTEVRHGCPTISPRDQIEASLRHWQRILEDAEQFQGAEQVANAKEQIVWLRGYLQALDDVPSHQPPR